MPKFSQRRQFLILLGIWAAITAGRLTFDVANTLTSWRESRIFFLGHAIKTSQALVRENRSRELNKYLRDAVSTGLIDHFVHETKEKSESFGSGPLERPVLPESLVEVDGRVWAKMETDSQRLYLSSATSWTARLGIALAEEGPHLPAEFFLLVVCFWLLNFSKRAADSSIGAREALLPKRESKRHRVAKQAASKPAPANDYMNLEAIYGRAALRQMGGRDTQDQEFFQSIDRFYAEASALLHRYGGAVHVLQGHELLFYFSHPEAKIRGRLALSFARDLELLAKAHGFVISIALSEGKVTGGRLAGAGFGIFGSPVDETAAFLLAMPENKSAAWVAKDLSERLGEYAELKLASEGRKLGAHVLGKMREVASVLEDCKKEECEELLFYRGKDGVAAALASLAEDSDWERGAFLAVISELKKLEWKTAHTEVTEAFRLLLQNELKKADSYRLSAVLAVAPHVLTRAAVDPAMEKLFLKSIAIKDRRIRANAVELFTRFFPEREIPELRSLIRDEDHRVSANALIKAACERFDEKVIHRIEERVRGGSVAHVASALHAMGEIALYYRAKDPVFLGTKANFLKLFDEIPHWVEHPNPMIRRQALLAAKKLGNPLLERRLREIFSDTEHPELLLLFSSTFGWSKEPSEQAA